MNKHIFWLTLTLSALFASCESKSKTIEDSINIENNESELKTTSQTVNFELAPDKTKMFLGDSLELILFLRINDSIIFSEYAYSYDDTLNTINLPEEGWKSTTKHSLWLSGGPGKHIVNGAVKIDLIDTTYWKNWVFEFEIIEN